MSVRVEPGDCLEVMARLKVEGVTVDAIVTDPPYHLTSIVKRFGKPGSAEAKFGTDGAFARASRGFMGKEWDGGDIAFRPETWRLAFDILKPGGHLVAFSGTRTYHRMACAIEDAGFEIRDQLAWVYGSGFPKSHDVAKGIDKACGPAREVISEEVMRDIRNRHGRALGEGIHAAERDGPVYTTIQRTAPATEAAKQWDGWGTALKPAWEPIVLARKPLIGTVVENVLQHGTGALNVDACRVGDTGARNNGRTVDSDIYGKFGPTARVDYDKGRWPANIVHDGSDEVLAAFPDAPGQQRGLDGSEQSARTVNTFNSIARTPFEPRGDSGSAARFFYTAKADAEDRLGSKHPTVKPVSLMRWLVRLITPPGGTVLDPFSGSGTTAHACIAERFNCIAIEREEEYLADIRRRIEFAEGRGPLRERATMARFDESKAAGADTPLFGSVPDKDAA